MTTPKDLALADVSRLARRVANTTESSPDLSREFVKAITVAFELGGDLDEITSAAVNP